MQFLNPNVPGEMVQLLQHNREKYVPCLTKGTNKTILEKVPLHGDQLFKKRARNVIWTYRDGVNDNEQLRGIDTELADWHAKYTSHFVAGPATNCNRTFLFTNHLGMVSRLTY